MGGLVDERMDCSRRSVPSCQTAGSPGPARAAWPAWRGLPMPHRRGRPHSSVTSSMSPPRLWREVGPAMSRSCQVTLGPESPALLRHASDRRALRSHLRPMYHAGFYDHRGVLALLVDTMPDQSPSAPDHL